MSGDRQWRLLTYIPGKWEGTTYRCVGVRNTGNFHFRSSFKRKGDTLRQEITELASTHFAMWPPLVTKSKVPIMVFVGTIFISFMFYVFGIDTSIFDKV